MSSFHLTYLVLLQLGACRAFLDHPISVSYQTQNTFNPRDWTHYVHFLQLAFLVIIGIIATVFLVRRCWPILRLFCCTPTSITPHHLPNISTNPIWPPPYGMVPQSTLGSARLPSTLGFQMPSAPQSPPPSSSTQIV